MYANGYVIGCHFVYRMMQFNTKIASITLSTFYFSILQVINISLISSDINDFLRSNNFTKNLCG